MKSPIILSLLAIPLPACSQTSVSDDPRLQEIRELKRQLLRISARLDALERQGNASASTPVAATSATPDGVVSTTSSRDVSSVEVASADAANLKFLRSIAAIFKSNIFLTSTAGVLRRAQTTATIGLVYWWGTKQGAW